MVTVELLHFVRTRAALAAWLVGVVAVVALAACSSSGSSASNSNSSSSPGSKTSAPVEPTSAAAESVAAFAKSQAPLDIPILSKKPAAGIKVDGVVCTIPTCQAAAVPAPFQSLGWEYTAFPYDLTKGPPALVIAFQNALQDKPKYILIVAPFPAVTFQPEIAAAQAAGIKVVEVAVPSAPGTDVLACAGCTAQQAETGKLQADTALADAAGATHIAYVTDPGVPLLGIIEASAKAEVAKLSPSSTSATVQVSSADPPTKTASTVANYLQRNPSTKYVIFAISELATGVPQTLASVGLSSNIKLITQAPQPTDLQAISNGTEFATIAAEDDSLMWRAADALARDSVGSTVPSTLINPEGWHQILTKANVGSSGSQPEPTNFVQTFKTAWRV
jgi:ABC-type sugar transport system substrate-binding protein